LGIVATVVILIDSLGGAVRKLLNKISSIPIMDIVRHRCRPILKNGTKVAKLARDFEERR